MCSGASGWPPRACTSTCCWRRSGRRGWGSRSCDARRRASTERGADPPPGADRIAEVVGVPLVALVDHVGALAASLALVLAAAGEVLVGAGAQAAHLDHLVEALGGGRGGRDALASAGLVLVAGVDAVEEAAAVL